MSPADGRPAWWPGCSRGGRDRRRRRRDQPARGRERRRPRDNRRPGRDQRDHPADPLDRPRVRTTARSATATPSTVTARGSGARSPACPRGRDDTRGKPLYRIDDRPGRAALRGFARLSHC